MFTDIQYEGIIIVGILAYGGFQLFKHLSLFNKHLKEKKAYQVKTKNKYVVMQDFQKWTSAYLLFSVGGIVCAILQLMDNEFVMAAAFVFFAVYSFIFALDAIIKRQALFDDTGFFYEEKYYKYKSVMKVVPRKGFFATSDLYIVGKDSFRICGKMGMVLEEQLKSYKNSKKRGK